MAVWPRSDWERVSPMKAISLWQPWASAIAAGAKRIETRHWPTRYRGPLAIHAAKRKVINELIYYHSCWNWQGAMRSIGWNFASDQDIHRLPFGALVATCDLVDCRPTESFTQGELGTPRRPEGDYSDLYAWTERQMGNFDLGRFSWVLDNVKPLPEPISWRGSQGFFEVSLDKAA